MFYRTRREDQLQNQSKCYEALIMQVSLLRSAYIRECGDEPNKVYLQKEDLDFVESYHGILKVIGRLHEKSTNELLGMKLKCGSQIEVASSKREKLNQMSFMRRNTM